MFRYQNTQLEIKNENLMQCNASNIGILRLVHACFITY